MRLLNCDDIVIGNKVEYFMFYRDAQKYKADRLYWTCNAIGNYMYSELLKEKKHETNS